MREQLSIFLLKSSAFSIKLLTSFMMGALVASQMSLYGLPSTATLYFVVLSPATLPPAPFLPTETFGALFGPPRPGDHPGRGSAGSGRGAALRQ